MMRKKIFNNSNIFMLLTVLVGAIFWSGILTINATPYGDGARIAPFVKVLDQSQSLFLMWSPINNGEPILASPEHFYLLGYLLEFGAYYNIFFNIILFCLMISLSIAGYLLARSLNVNENLSFLYATSLIINGWIIEVERSARVQTLAISICTLLVCYMFIRKNQYAKIGIPIMIAISIYNGIHYSATTIISLIIVSFFQEQKEGLKRSLNLVFKGALFSLPFLLPAILHPMINGWDGLNDLRYEISTVSIIDLLFPTSAFTDAGTPKREFLGFQVYLFFPMILVLFLYKRTSPFWLLYPITPWLFFVFSNYSIEFKKIIENTLISNWRHNIIFYQIFLLFGYLFIVKAISCFGYKSRIVFTCLFTFFLGLTFTTIFDAARANFREDNGQKLHVSNKEHKAFELLKRNGVTEQGKNFRIYYDGNGISLEGARVFRSFSYFNSYGFSAFTSNLKGSILKSRPHWSEFESPCIGLNVEAFSYAGYRYLVCKQNYDLKLLEKNNFQKIDSLGPYYLFESTSSYSFGVACNPDSIIVSSLNEYCERSVNGLASYEGNSIKANLQVDAKTTIFFHENYALGWIGLVNSEFRLPRKVHDVFIGFDLAEGAQKIYLYYIDPFFVLGFIAIFIYVLLMRALK